MPGCISKGFTINKDKEFLSVIYQSIQEAYIKSFDIDIDDENMFTVWFCKTLQNFKAIIVVKINGECKHFCECSYNGDKQEIYIDLYKKEKNVPFVLKEWDPQDRKYMQFEVKKETK